MQEIPAGSVISFDATMLGSLGIQWINVAIITIALIWILYKPVKKFMENRENRIKENIDSAAKDWEAAQVLKAEYEQKTEQLESERELILQRTHTKAMDKCDLIIHAAQERADLILAQAKEQADLIKKQGREQMKTQIIDLSTVMAQKYVALSLDDRKKNELVDRAFEDLMEG